MNAVAVAALEAVTVEQRQEQLKVLLLAGVRGRRHEQQVPRDPAEGLVELVTPRRLQLGAEVVRGHPVRLVDDHEVPVAALQLGGQLLGAR